MSTTNKLFGLLLAAMLLLTACGPAATPAPADTQAPAAGGTVTIGGVDYSTAYSGKTVTIFGVAADEQARLFQKEFDEFSQKTGIKVEYEGNKDFETLILV